jgi:hypothetical protein
MQFVDSGIESASASNTETSDESEEEDDGHHFQPPPDDDDSDGGAGGPAISQRSPPYGNMDGFLQSIYQGGGPGITKPLTLGKNNRGETKVLPPPTNADDWLLIDTAMMRGMFYSGTPRAIEDIGRLNKQILKELLPKNDVAKVKGWYHLDDQNRIVIAPKSEEMYSDADENEYALVKNELEKHFCDNFSVLFRRMPKDGGAFQYSEMTGKELFKQFAWECGMHAQSHQKYFLTRQKQTKAEKSKPVGKS